MPLDNIKRLLIVTALAEEFRPIKAIINHQIPGQGAEKTIQGQIDGHLVELIQTGIGLELTATRLKSVLNPNGHGAILAVGFCGALDPEIKVIDACVVKEVMGPDSMTWSGLEPTLVKNIGVNLEKLKIPFHITKHSTQSQPVESPEAKAKLFNSLGAQSVDMEIAEVLSVGQKFSIPVAAVKFTIDASQDRIPNLKQGFKADQWLAGNIRVAAERLRVATPVIVKAVVEKLGM
ncbi:MAG: hypothetical protein IT289_04020 [Oligoflexia bacterium]|nr:hypothetical protein [Oligoflexia bacterium]